MGFNGNVEFDVSAIDRYTDTNALKITVMAKWTQKSGLNITGRYLFPNTYKDFQKKTIKIGIREVSLISEIVSFDLKAS